MCLMWCHVQRWVVDNDLPCDGCNLGQSARLPSTWSCGSCRHAQGGRCALTREAQPLLGRCCHWQVEPTPHGMLVLEEGQLAPWLRSAEGMAVVFAASPTAPPLQRDVAGRVMVNPEELSVPLVFGVESPRWDAALGWGPAAGAPELHWDVPLDDERQRAIFGLLAALDVAEVVGVQGALVQLQVALDGISTPLPHGWAVLLADLVRLGQDICAEEGVLVEQFAVMEQLLKHTGGERC